MDQLHHTTGTSTSTPSAGPSFGRGWIPASRDIGLPGDSLPEPSCRRDGWTPERRVRFLDRLAGHGSVSAACAAVRMSREAAYRLRRRDGLFAEAWDSALIVARGVVEEHLADCAVNGFREAVFYHGEEVGSRRRFDGRLLLAHLARLDAAAADPQAKRRAARFDELLALVAGETFAEDMADAPHGLLYEADPLLPMERERYVVEAGYAAYKAAQGAALAEIVERDGGDEAFDPDYDDTWPSLALLEPGDAERVAQAQWEADEAGRLAAATAWDDWQARSRAVSEALDEEGDDCAPAQAGGSGLGEDGSAEARGPRLRGEAGEEGAVAGPGENISLDPVDFVNFADTAAPEPALYIASASEHPAAPEIASGTGEDSGCLQPARSSAASSRCGKSPMAFPARSRPISPPARSGKITAL